MTDTQRKYLLLKAFNLLDDRTIYDPKANTVYTNDPMYIYHGVHVKSLTEYKESNNENTNENTNEKS